MLLNLTEQSSYTIVCVRVFGQHYPVAKAALRLLHLFVDYSECSSFLLLQAVADVTASNGTRTV